MSHVFVDQVRNISIVVDLYNKNDDKTINKTTIIIIIYLFSIIISLNFSGEDFSLIRLLDLFVSINPSLLLIDKNLFFL